MVYITISKVNEKGMDGHGSIQTVLQPPAGETTPVIFPRRFGPLYSDIDDAHKELFMIGVMKQIIYLLVVRVVDLTCGISDSQSRFLCLLAFVSWSIYQLQQLSLNPVASCAVAQGLYIGKTYLWYICFFCTISTRSLEPQSGTNQVQS